MMALSVRHSPYTIPSPRFNSMASTTYNPAHFSSGGIPAPGAGPSSYNIPSSSMLGLQSSVFSSMSPLATCGTALQRNLNPTMNLLPTALNSTSSSSVGMDSSGPGAMACLSDTSAPDHSPASCCSADSPTSPPDLSVEDSPLPYKSCSVGGCYSSLSPPSSPSGLPTSMYNGSRSPPPPPPPPSLPAGSSLPYPPPSTAMLPAPMYSSQDYSSSSFSSFSSSMPSSFSSSSMSSLGMPMWSPYPSLPNVGPLPSPSLPKLSYDSPRYKLTPERAIPLIKWFEEHKEHPYPTRHEKILLCQSTQLTFTQVSTWFANARRRMKKAISEEEESSSQGSGSSSERENSPDCSHNSNLRS